SFGLGGYYRTPIEEALPVTMEVKQKVEIPSLAVVLSIDRSGSMAMSTDEKITKLDLAKEASHLVVDLLDERNEVGVMSWDTEFIWDSPVRPAKDKSAIHHAIATIKAGGGTDGYPALKESYAVLIERPFKPQLTAPAHEAMQEIDWKNVPPLGGYVATTLKPTAELVLMSHQEDPVLATWRFGLGRAAAFTSDAKAKWAVLWLRW